MAFGDLIPLVGATLAAVLIGVVTLFNDFPGDTIIWAIFAVGYQQFENYVIQPQIQKRAVELEPFVILVSVLFGAHAVRDPGRAARDPDRRDIPDLACRSGGATAWRASFRSSATIRRSCCRAIPSRPSRRQRRRPRRRPGHRRASAVACAPMPAVAELELPSVDTYDPQLRGRALPRRRCASCASSSGWRARRSASSRSIARAASSSCATGA